jgi:hypothetical protein
MGYLRRHGSLGGRVGRLEHRLLGDTYDDPSMPTEEGSRPGVFELLSPEEIESLYAALDRLHAGEEAPEVEKLWELVEELIDYVMEDTRGSSS